MASECEKESPGPPASTEECDGECDGDEIDSDYYDLGLVEIWHDQSRDIFEILKLQNTTRDKLMYTVFSLNIFATCFLIGYLPKYFYIWHTAKALVLLTYRWYAYKKQRYHYFMFDLCYFCNFLILVYLWLPEQVLGSTVRGGLFSVCFAMANGPVLCAIVFWRNSLVPHSVDKMTSLFIHVSPTMALCGLKWFSTPEQGFPLCSTHHTSGCSDVSAMEVLYYPLMAYMAWQCFYLLIMDFVCKERVEKREYVTSYKYMAEQARGQSVLVKLFNFFGPKYRKLTYWTVLFLYTLLSIHLAYFCYMYMVVNILAVFAVMGVASYNGASFYIDVFSHKYNASISKSK